MKNQVTLPWPHKELSPNARVHWAKKARITKAYRELCFYMAKDKKLKPGHIMKMTFHPPDNRRRDDDNMIASFKAGRDGVADAVGVDDAQFKLQFERGYVKTGGAVVVEIVENEA